MNHHKQSKAAPRARRCTLTQTIELLEPRRLLSAGLLESTVTLPNGESVYFGQSQPVVIGDNAIWFGGVGNTVEYNAQTQQLSLISNAPDLAGGPRASAVAGSDAVFAGGYNSTTDQPTTNVEIYDTTNGQWSSGNLSLARSGMAAVSVGNLAIFAGGYTGSFYSQVPSDVVDIYAANTAQWTTSTMPVAPANFAAVTGLSLGTDAIFADNQRLQVFNSTNGTWSVTALPHVRADDAVVALGTYVVVAGGYYQDRRHVDHALTAADVYDVDNGQWSTASVPAAPYSFSGVVAGAKAVFAGTLEEDDAPYRPVAASAYLFDSTTKTFQTVAAPPAEYDFSTSVAIGDKAIFMGRIGTDTVVYDTDSGQWQILGPRDGAPIPAVADGQLIFTEGLLDWTNGPLPTNSSINLLTLSDSAPTAIAPASGEVLATRRPELSWTAVPGATSYDVYLDVDNSSTEAPLTSVTTNSFTPSAAIAPGQHEWLVVANTPAGSVSGAEQSFTISGAAIYPRISSLTLPQTLTATTTATASVVVANTGDLPTTEPFSVQIVAALNTNTSKTTVLGSAVVQESLAPGQSVVVHVPVSLANAPLTPQDSPAVVFYIGVDTAPLRKRAHPSIAVLQKGDQFYDVQA